MKEANFPKDYKSLHVKSVKSQLNLPVPAYSTGQHTRANKNFPYVIGNRISPVTLHESHELFLLIRLTLGYDQTMEVTFSLTTASET